MVLLAHCVVLWIIITLRFFLLYFSRSSLFFSFDGQFLYYFSSMNVDWININFFSISISRWFTMCTSNHRTLCGNEALITLLEYYFTTMTPFIGKWHWWGPPTKTMMSLMKAILALQRQSVPKHPPHKHTHMPLPLTQSVVRSFVRPFVRSIAYGKLKKISRDFRFSNISEVEIQS